MAGDLSQYERAAYHAILRALALSPASWETEEILTQLRMVLHITDEVHMDYRARVSADHEVTELRELQKAQGQLGMQQPSLSMQASMAVNPASMGQPLAPSMSMDASGAGMAPPLSCPPMPGGLMPQKSVTGTGTRSQIAGGIGLGAPMGSFPTSAGGASAMTGRGTAAQRRTGAASMGPARTASVATGVTGKSGAKKGAAASKAKQNSRFQAAVPQGVDIMEHDLRGYMLERRQDDLSSWKQAVVVTCKREATGQRLTLVYNLGTPEEMFEHDVFLRKGKADILWRFARPTKQLQDDWDAVAARDRALTGSAAAGGGGARGSGGPGAGGPGAGAPSKKRKAVAAAPYTKEAVAQAISASMTSHKVDDLKAMLASIQERRQSVVGQLALERVREMLKGMSVSTAKEQLQRELEAVRRKRSALETNGGDADGVAAGGARGAAPAGAAAAVGAAPPAGAVPAAAGAALASGAARDNGAANGTAALPPEDDEETDVD